MSYKHGVYGTVAETFEPTSVAQGTIPVYIGSLPVHRINTTGKASFDYSPYVNKPILISSLRQVREMGLYSDDWKTYTLCEAIHAHFMNGENNVSPIIVVNVLDPADADGSEENSFYFKKNGKKVIATIKDPVAVLDNYSITGSKAQNISVTYNGDEIVIEGEGEADNSEVMISYTKIAFSSADFDETNIQAALDSLDYCEQITGVIPNILVAPSISETPALNDLLVQKAIEKLSGKWNIVVLSDIPSATVKTYDVAKSWKENTTASKYSKLYWPSFGYGDKVYHGSTIGAYMMQYTDTQNNDVPYVSTSNKVIFCDRAVVGDNETLLVSEQEANELNKVGITTANFINRRLRLWGSHMSNYDFDTVESIAPEDRFDTSIRMSMFILNYLQNQYINEIDEAFTSKDVDSIINGIQTWLDSLVNDGMLLSATVAFNNDANSDDAIANGDFVFDLSVTYSVLAKSITFKLQYSKSGLMSLTTAGGEE